MILVTFGQTHFHRVGGKQVGPDCVALVRDREHAFDLFGGKFCFTYDVERQDDKSFMEYFRDGVVDLTEEKVSEEKESNRDIRNILEGINFFENSCECENYMSRARVFFNRTIKLNWSEDSKKLLIKSFNTIHIIDLLNKTITGRHNKTHNLDVISFKDEIGLEEYLNFRMKEIPEFKESK